MNFYDVPADLCGRDRGQVAAPLNGSGPEDRRGTGERGGAGSLVCS
jgi:hypothetical protein